MIRYTLRDGCSPVASMAHYVTHKLPWRGHLMGVRLPHESRVLYDTKE